MYFVANQVVPGDLRNPPSTSGNRTEVKSQQMMGATVVSSGDHFVVRPVPTLVAG